VEKPSMLNTIARGAIGQLIPEGSISIMNLLNEQWLDKIAKSAGTFLEELRNIQISQRKCSNCIYNCMAHQNHRYNHTRICSAFYLLSGWIYRRHSFSSCNMEFHLPSPPYQQTNQDKARRPDRTNEKKQNPSDDRRTTAYILFIARTPSLRL